MLHTRYNSYLKPHTYICFTSDTLPSDRLTPTLPTTHTYFFDSHIHMLHTRQTSYLTASYTCSTPDTLSCLTASTPHTLNFLTGTYEYICSTPDTLPTWKFFTYSLVYLLKGIVQRIRRGVETRLIPSVLVNWRPAHFSFLNFKGTPSQEEHKTIFSILKTNEMTLSDQRDFPAFFHLQKMTYRNFINSGIW